MLVDLSSIAKVHRPLVLGYLHFMQRALRSHTCLALPSSSTRLELNAEETDALASNGSSVHVLNNLMLMPPLMGLDDVVLFYLTKSNKTEARR